VEPIVGLAGATDVNSMYDEETVIVLSEFEFGAVPFEAVTVKE
jgi:hypothetical protein